MTDDWTDEFLHETASLFHPRLIPSHFWRDDQIERIARSALPRAATLALLLRVARGDRRAYRQYETALRTYDGSLQRGAELSGILPCVRDASLRVGFALRLYHSTKSRLVQLGIAAVSGFPARERLALITSLSSVENPAHRYQAAEILARIGGAAALAIAKTWRDSEPDPLVRGVLLDVPRRVRRDRSAKPG